MTAQEFIASKGNITDPDIRFLQGGQLTIIPLADLLDEFAGKQVEAPTLPAPVKKPKATKVTKKK